MGDLYEELPHPWEHQGEGVSMLLQGSGACWFDPRLGKTRTALEAARIKGAMGAVDRAVIVGTVNALEVWRREADVYLPHWPVEVVRGMRPEPLAASTRVVILNPVILTTQFKRGNLLQGWLGTLIHWFGQGRGLLVLDECHKYATNKSKQRDAVRQLALVARLVWELTGTYYEKSALDAHHQLQLLGSRYPYFHRDDRWFAERYCERKFNPHKGGLKTGTRRDGTSYQYRAGGTDYMGMKDGAEDDLMRALQGVVLRRRRSECLDVPDTRLMPMWVDHYDQTVEFRRDEMERLRSELVLLKCQRTIDYVENDLPERPVVVFGWHRKLLTHLANHWRAPLIFGETSQRERIRLRDEFQAGQHPIMVCTLGMDAVDLARADHCVYAEIDWSATKMRQSMDRIVNGSKHRETVAHILLVSGSVEEEVWTRILLKGQALERLDLAARRLRELGMAELMG